MRKKKSSQKRLVLIGNGMAGIACLEQILRHTHEYEITVFGDETHVNYNRILLSSVLAGEKNIDEITLNPIDWYLNNKISLRLGIRISGIDRDRKRVLGDDGSEASYDKLIIATGSSPFMPPSMAWTRNTCARSATWKIRSACSNGRGPERRLS